MKTSILTLAATLLTLSVIAQWQTVGTAGFTQGSVQYLQLAVDNGTPYVAFKDGANSEKCTAMKFNGSTWELVGTAGFSEGIARDQSLCVVDGTPYVVYTDAHYNSKPRVAKFNGTDWEYVGDFVSNAYSYGNAIAIRDSIIYVAVTTASYAYLYKYVDSTWSQVSYYPASMSGAVDVDIAIQPSTGKPYLVYSDSYNGSRATVVKPNTNGWDNVGTMGFSDNPVTQCRIVFKDDVPYVSFRDATTKKVTVMSYEGAWAVEGTAGFSPGNVLTPDIAIYDNRAHVAFCDEVDNQAGASMYFNGAEWLDKESSSVSIGKATGQRLESSGGDLYMAYIDWENSQKATLVKFVECDVDLTVSLAGPSLTSNANGATYQWFDCNAFGTIPGQTGKSFMPTANGSYAVIVSDGDCSDTSACTNFTLGVEDAAEHSIRLYPNPASDVLTIDARDQVRSYLIYNATGAEVMRGSEHSILMAHLAEGLYFIEINTSSGTMRSRFMKN